MREGNLISLSCMYVIADVNQRPLVVCSGGLVLLAFLALREIGVEMPHVSSSSRRLSDNNVWFLREMNRLLPDKK